MENTVNVKDKNLYLFEYNNKYFIYDINSMDIYNVSYDEYLTIKDSKNLKLLDDILNNDINYENIVKNQPYNDKIPLHTIAIEVSNDCNLRCKYCYGDGGTYGGEKCLMTKDTALKCVDFLVSNSKNSKKLSIIFFGGEPLMNYNVIKNTVYYCNSIKKEKT